MQNDRDDQYRNYDDNSRNSDNKRKDIIGYSAIPGPSFDAGRYGTDQNRSYDHVQGRDRDQTRDRNEGIINRHFDDSTLGSSQYSTYGGDRSRTGSAQSSGNGDYSYDMSRDFRGSNRQSHFNDTREKSQEYIENRRMGGIGSYGEPGGDRLRNDYNSEQAASMPMRTAYERYHGHGKADRSNDWIRDMDRNRDYRRNSGNSSSTNSSYGYTSYAGPTYGSIQTGGRFDNDRDFTSGGISNMGGDYDRDRTRGRQYRDNYDSAGSYIGDYRRNQGDNDYNNGGSNRYDSGFTFGSSSSNRNQASHRPENEDRSYGSRSQNRSGDSHWGGRYASDQDWNRNRGSHYGSSGYDNQWRENRSHNQANRHSHNPSDPSRYRSLSTQTGNPDYDRGNFRAADYVHNRPGHQEEDRSFFEKAGERVRSWFGGHDDDDRNRY